MRKVYKEIHRISVDEFFQLTYKNSIDKREAFKLICSVPYFPERPSRVNFITVIGMQIKNILLPLAEKQFSSKEARYVLVYYFRSQFSTSAEILKDILEYNTHSSASAAYTRVHNYLEVDKKFTKEYSDFKLEADTLLEQFFNPKEEPLQRVKFKVLN